MLSFTLPNLDFNLELDINSLDELFLDSSLEKLFSEKDYAFNILSKLRRILEILANAYYDKDQPLVEDKIYDAFYRAYEWIENKYPEFKLAKSPTSVIGGTADSSFAKVHHKVRMESLQDIFSIDEISKQIAKIESLAYAKLDDSEYFSPLLGSSNLYLSSFSSSVESNSEEEMDSSKINARELHNQYVVEEKIDGLSVSIEYKNGIFFRASTRGDGDFGEDITENMRQLKDLALRIDTDASYLELRAEVYMPKLAFEALNEDRARSNLPLFANPRNAAAGSIRQLDSSITAERNLSFFIFNIQQVEGIEFNSHSESLSYIKKLGLPVSPNFKKCRSLSEIVTAVLDINSRRNSLEYGIDGAVIKLDNLKLREKLGSTAKVPRWAFAYKYEAEIAVTKLKDINWQLGRTGVLTPVAVLDEVLLAGTRVSSATLNNAATILEKDIRLGDYVNVRKAGDIIPEVINVDISRRSNLSEKYKLPKFCPNCESILSWDKNGRSLVCNNPNCTAKLFRKILHFASKVALNIMGLGENSLKLFFDNGLIRNISDIFRLENHKDFIIESESFPTYKEKKIDNLLKEIDKAKSKDLSSYLVGFGIDGVGKSVAKLLVKEFSTIDAIKNASIENLLSLSGIGDEIAYSIHQYFHDDNNLEQIDELISLGCKCLSRSKDTLTNNNEANSFNDDNNKNINSEFIDGKENIFFNKKIVITGNLNLLSREEASEILDSLGAKVTSSVSKNTDLLIAGDAAGSKLSKAHSLNVKVMNKDEFLDILKEYKCLDE